MYDRKDEEFAADFIAISRRTLTDSEYKLFKFHYLLGADGKLCCARLGLDRGSFFHAIYRIQQKLGRAFRETQPYGIFPVYAYYEDQRVPAEATVVEEPGKMGSRVEVARRKNPIRAEHPYSLEDPIVRRRRIA